MEQHTCCAGASVTDKELMQQLSSKLDDFVGKPGGLIPALQYCQALLGYVPQEAITLISERLNEPLHKVYGVVTFYSFFSMNPRGSFTVRVCMGTACYVRGAQEVLESLKEHLGIDVGETTEDRMFSLEVGRCFGACGLAPVIMVNDEVYQEVKPSGIAAILDAHRTRGPRCQP